MPNAHRDGDVRSCGAVTKVVGQRHVFVDKKLWAVAGDPNSHGGGGLIPSKLGVFINKKPVIDHKPASAAADALCGIFGGAHCKPTTGQGSRFTFSYGGTAGGAGGPIVLPPPVLKGITADNTRITADTTLITADSGPEGADVDILAIPSVGGLILSTDAPIVVVSAPPDTAVTADSTTATADTGGITADNFTEFAHVINPASADLILSPTTPDVTSSGVTISQPATIDLLLSTTAPDVTATGVTVSQPATIDLLLSTTAPFVQVSTPPDTTVTADSDTTTADTGGVTADNVTEFHIVNPPSVDLILSMTAPSVTASNAIVSQPATIDLLLSTTAPSVTATDTIVSQPATSDLLLSTTAPSVTRTTRVTADVTGVLADSTTNKADET